MLRKKSETVNENNFDHIMKWLMYTAAPLYLAASVLIMMFDFVNNWPMTILLLLCFVIASPLLMIATVFVYCLRHSFYNAVGLWYALIFLMGALAVPFSYLFLEGHGSLFDPVGGLWVIVSVALSLIVALTMSIVDYVSKQARLRGVAGVVLSLATLLIVSVSFQWITTYKELGFK